VAGAGADGVTRAEFSAFIHETGHECEHGASVPVGSGWRHEPTASWREPGFEQDRDHPAVCISWEDAKAYVAWLSRETSKDYRLLSEAEWEYAARADTTAPFWFGNTIAPTQANFDATHAYGSSEKGAWFERTVRVSDYSPNPWGLYQVHGNVWEWCEDPWHNTYVNAPGDSAVWLRGADEEYRAIRGGSWHNPPWHLRSANRFRYQPYQRLNTVGFRIARSL
jgi:formylglycine-generating enzyme required for sulfatase activity